MKTGKTAKDIFAPTTTIKSIENINGPGRPPIHDEAWTKVTVVLLNRQIVYLDRLANDIRANTGSAIKRAEILRALVDALAESNIDLLAATSENDLKATLRASLSR